MSDNRLMSSVLNTTRFLKGMAMKKPAFRTALALTAALSISACAGPSEAPSADAVGTGALAGCPQKTVIQLGWYPEMERAWALNLIGPDGEIDAAKGIYSGPAKADPSVTIEVRAGGPYVGFQQGNAMLYQDEDILIADQNLDAMVGASGKFPTVAVAAPLEKGPQILFGDPTKHDFSSAESIRESGAKIVVASNAIYMQALVAAGVFDAENVEYSFDGSLSRFISDPSIVNQGFVTNEPYQLEHVNPAWKKPIGYMLVSDAGYPWYQAVASTRSEYVTKYAECFKSLVPEIQRAQVDFATNPDEMFPVIQTLGTTLRDPLPQTPEFLANGLDTAKEYGVIANGNTPALGDFDLDRVQKLIDLDLAAFEEAGEAYPYDKSITPQKLVTNEFIDPNIGL